VQKIRSKIGLKSFLNCNIKDATDFIYYKFF
jgi:hypothetical protein